MVIGLAGVAGSGKDTFYSILSSKIKAKRFSLADKLKEEVRPWCWKHYGIDPLNCHRHEKELVRDFLVFHAKHMREKTNGRYWVDKIDDEVRSSTEKYKIITDIRYDDYQKDEVSWLKNELGGCLVHISMVDLNGCKVGPANSEEARNDPKLIEKADFKVEWPLKQDATDLNKELSPYVEEVMFQAGIGY
tara:strand:+ start:11931 stop:12500 length:570 start_codon:yes stop_codon:yes gene_type:complete